MFQTNVRWGENGNASPQEAKDYADHTDYNVKRYALNKAQEMLERAGSRTQVQLLPASLVYGTHGNTLCVSRHGIPVYNLSNCKKDRHQVHRRSVASFLWRRPTIRTPCSELAIISFGRATKPCQDIKSRRAGQLDPAGSPYPTIDQRHGYPPTPSTLPLVVTI